MCSNCPEGCPLCLEDEVEEEVERNNREENND